MIKQFILVALEDYGINTQHQWNVIVKETDQCEELNIFALVRQRKSYLSQVSTLHIILPAIKILSKALVFWLA